jgi:membrane-bound metal-dependent hydrolase YbcI (DUF457 family)
MPTPLGHALAGATAGTLLVASVPPVLSRVWRLAAVFGVLGMLPDLDLLGLPHRGVTHSLGMAAIVGLAAAAFARQSRFGLAAAGAYATHTLLDWLSADTSLPLGIMALWPFSQEYYKASTPVFDSVWRRNETPDFWPHNIRAVARELAILVPPALLALWVILRRMRQGPKI